MDFTVSGITYDGNGNLTAMTQRGLKINTPVTIDSLNYTYVTNSNRLAKIKDFITDTDPWGDFKDTSLTTNDYAYDVNGNIVKDSNKHIHTSGGGNGITYNFLDKVTNINVNGKGSVAYTYDAAGTLLQKTATDNITGLKTLTTYIAGFVYEQRYPAAGSAGTDTLQYVLHEEGRIRKSIKTNMQTGAVTMSLEYDYFLKDHLGNIRTTLTEEQRTDAYPVASLETAALSNQQLYYTNLTNGKVNKSTVPGYPTDGYTIPNDFIQKLNSGNKIGATMLLKVMAGDKITVRANSWYNNTASPQSPVSPLADIVSALTNSIPLVSGDKIIQSQLTSTVLNPSVSGFLNTRDAGGAGTKPKAWFNIVLLDEQLNPVITNDGKNSFFEQVGTSGVLKQHTSVVERPVTMSGYVYIYVSNETPNIDVFFDNLQVTHKRGALLNESAYYPFGLEMKGISSNAATTIVNNYKFNSGTELNDNFDINYYETYYRNYDAQIGRFTGVDLLAELEFGVSPYTFGVNDPVFWSDRTGLLNEKEGGGDDEWDPMGHYGFGSDWGFSGIGGGSSSGGGLGGMSLWAWVGFYTGNYGGSSGGGGTGWGMPGGGSFDGHPHGGGGNGKSKNGSEDNDDWQPLYKKDLIDYANSINHPTSENDLGNLFEDIFENYMKTESPMSSKLLRFTRNTDLWDDDENRNTVPDFTADGIKITYFMGLIPRKREIIKNSSAWELKQSKKKGIYLSSNNNQIKGHINNLRAKQIKNILTGFRPDFSLVSTYDVKYSGKIYRYAKKRGIQYVHIRAQYKIIDGAWQFRFEEVGWSDQRDGENN